jgi:hypothetical protein
MDPDILAILAAALSAGALSTSLLGLLKARREINKDKIKASKNGDQVEVDLNDPDQARLYLREYLDRNQSPNTGAEK